MGLCNVVARSSILGLGTNQVNLFSNAWWSYAPNCNRLPGPGYWLQIRRNVEMRISSSKWMLTVSALVLPGMAHAQEIPLTIAAIALSPLLVLLFAAVLGVVVRSWAVGVAHAGLVAVWIVLFGVASYWVENDYVIWTPLVLYGVHAITLIILIIKGVVRRIRA